MDFSTGKLLSQQSSASVTASVFKGHLLSSVLCSLMHCLDSSSNILRDLIDFLSREEKDSHRGRKRTYALSGRCREKMRMER